jgi:phage tail tape-measure protein
MAAEDYVLATGGGALSGAATGAAVGTALGGPVLGTAAGAVVGGVLGYFGQKQADDQAKEAEKLARQQARRQKNLAAKQRSVERRAAAQERESIARAAKTSGTLPPPSVATGTEFALVQSMALGTGSPFDSYIMKTYGRPQASEGV